MVTASAEKPFQFTLRQMLWLVSVACAAAAAWYWLGVCAVVVAGPLLAGGLWYFYSRRIVDAVSIAVLFLLVAALFLPTFDGGTRNARRLMCPNNLRMITLALIQYESKYGTLPPAYIADATGKPMHSWRVLILPFLEQKHLYNQYRFDEPWDGPNNRLLHDQIPNYLTACPTSRRTQPRWETNYVAVVGPGTAWPGSKSMPLNMVSSKDGTTNTILLVETHRSGIHWMEPRDLPFGQMPMQINNPPRGAGISSPHKGGANVAFCDGRTEFLDDKLAPETLRALLTASGGEKVNADDY